MIVANVLFLYDLTSLAVLLCKKYLVGSTYV